MKNKKVIKNSSIQLTIDFHSDSINCFSEENCIALDKRFNILSKNQTIVVNINDSKKYIHEQRSKKIIEYIINNAKRF